MRLRSQRRRREPCAASYQHKDLLFSTRPLTLYISCNVRPGVIFELRWSARIPLARPGGAGHDGKTSWYGSNRNGVAGSLRNQQSTQKPALFATRSLAVYSRRSMILKPSLSFAGPCECRWQGRMMGNRRGTAQITTAPPAGCAASNRHKNLLFSQLARSLCTAGET